MKLISCYIQNYGKFKCADFTFGEGLTQFCESNGWGKTTLASFLKAMFYGLPADTARSRFNERRRFYPFEGGKFGGNVTFLSGGDTYRIERFFDKRSEVADEMRVYKNGTPTDEFDKKCPGEVIFGLDEASFTRTVFVTSDQIEMCSTGGINAKLNDYVDATEGETDFPSALDALEKAAKKLKMRGGKGLIAEQEAAIRELRNSVADTLKIAESLDAKYAESNALRQEIAALEEGERAANANNLLLQKWKQYDDILSYEAGYRAELNALNAAYPAGIPDREELLSLAACSKELNDLRIKGEAAAFDRTKTDRLEELERLFSDGVPGDGEMKAADGAIAALRDEKSEIRRLTETQPSPEQQALLARYGGKTPAKQQIDEMTRIVDRYRTNDAARNGIPANGAADKPKGRGRIAAALYAAAVPLLIIGIVLFALSQPLIGAILVGACAVAAAGATAALVADRRRLAEREQSAKPSDDAVAEEQTVRSFLSQYGVSSDRGVAYDFEKFLGELDTYRTLTAAAREREERIATLRAQAQEHEQQLDRYFERYAISDGEYQTRYIRLTVLTAEYMRLNEEKEACAARAAGIREQRKQVAQRADDVLGKYRLTRENDFDGQIRDLERDGAAMVRLNAGIAQQREKAVRFRTDNRLDTRPETAPAPPEEDYASRLRAKRARLADLNREIADGEAETEKLGDKRNRLENAEERLEEYKARYGVLTAAAEQLKEAERKLTDKYIAPVKDRFIRYTDALERALGERVSMDKDFRITFERGGENRSDGHLSAGQRAVCALCFRLSLIDNMFEGEKPFIMMDDPFVDLDEEHLHSTAVLLRELAADKQIIYFCCHDSRAILPS